jgi:hypothetical protein
MSTMTTIAASPQGNPPLGADGCSCGSAGATDGDRVANPGAIAIPQRRQNAAVSGNG